MTRYGINPSDDLQQLFAAMPMPYQGQDPHSAKIIFVGIDANYSEEISADRCFFQKILEYHEDGVVFWKANKTHHPFLLPQYPLPKNTGGVPYHRKFHSMGLSPDFAEHISFVELLNVPTTGNTDRKIFWRLFNPEHAKALDTLFMNKSRCLIFLSNSVISYMREAKKKYQIFNWLPKHCEWGVFHQIGDTEFFKAKHFSAAISLDELCSMGALIRRFCSK